MRAALWILALSSLGACHEGAPAPAITPSFGETRLALGCNEDFTCERGVCDRATLACVDCLSDGDCAVGRCHPRADVCVQCLGDGDCAEGFCHPTRAVCVACYDDAQCAPGTTGATDAANEVGVGLCHPELLACVECIADRDCGSGRCNPEIFACVGQCASDAQCDDGNSCTAERCREGTCVYHAAADRPVAPDCCPPLACAPDQRRVDGDQDGCDESCSCGDEPACAPGTTPVDSDQGACPDACACASGVVIEPGGECPCAVDIACDGGLVPSDLTGDGCPDTCAKPCVSACDCAAQGLEARTPCPLDCATCGPFLECLAGACVGRCGVIPERPCDCPPAPGCGPLESAFDSDADGCNDACRCLVEGPNGCACPVAIACAEGSSPVDTDQDGCPDACACDDANRVPGPDGSCCPRWECPAGQEAADADGDGCADTCVCASGDDPSFALPACPCKELVCSEGTTPTDADNDGCPDTCLCDNGATPGPDGCGACLASCEGKELPPWTWFTDHDGDGCYDEVHECPVGSTAAASPGAGCPDFCAPCREIACPQGARPADSDGDRCPDTCECADGAAAPPEGCGCREEIACAAPAVPVDLDHDGCLDACRTPCLSACDCKPLVDGCDCADCRAAAACVDGFCASSCVQPVDACLTPIAGDEVCGCDGKTYASRCEAGVAGVDIGHGGTCGIGCASDADCAPGERCETPSGQCSALVAANSGSCVIVPTSCLAARDPVCGCDGKTYPNDCERLRAGIAQASPGSCAEP